MNIDELIELGDSDEIIREIDRLCERREWNQLLSLRDRCRLATERGKQLWGAAGHAEYRLALEGSAEFAALMVDAEPGQFVLGPLPEVVASTHRWHDIRDEIANSPMRSLTAYECVARGEDLSDDETLRDIETEFGLPLRLQPWEPTYEVAIYKAFEAQFPKPAFVLDDPRPIVSEHATDIDDPYCLSALLRLTEAWTSGSNGIASAVVIEGGISEVCGALDIKQDIGRIETKAALSLMAWAAASGGAHGRRAGAAAGRAKLWWALAHMADFADDWPHPANELGDYVDQLEWWSWDSTFSDGWSLKVAAIDPQDNIAFAIEATDVKS